MPFAVASALLSSLQADEYLGAAWREGEVILSDGKAELTQASIHNFTLAAILG